VTIADCKFVTASTRRYFRKNFS